MYERGSQLTESMECDATQDCQMVCDVTFDCQMDISIEEEELIQMHDVIMQDIQDISETKKSQNDNNNEGSSKCVSSASKNVRRTINGQTVRQGSDNSLKVKFKFRKSKGNFSSKSKIIDACKSKYIAKDSLHLKPGLVSSLPHSEVPQIATNCTQ